MANPFEIIKQELPKFLEEMNVPFAGKSSYTSVMDQPSSRDMERETNEALLGGAAMTVPAVRGLRALFSAPGVVKYGIPAGLTAATGDPSNLIPGAAGLAATSGDAEALLSKANLSASEVNQIRSILKGGGNLQDIFKQMKLARVLPISDDINKLGEGWERFQSTPFSPFGTKLLEHLKKESLDTNEFRGILANEFLDNFPQGRKTLISANPNLNDNTIYGQYYQPDVANKGRGVASFNSAAPRTLDQIKKTIFHELQHDHDHLLGRTSGFSLDKVTPDQVDEANKTLSSLYENAPSIRPFDVYTHNIGEARARLNAILETSPDEYKNLHSIFSNEGYRGYPNLIKPD